MFSTISFEYFWKLPRIDTFVRDQNGSPLGGGDTHTRIADTQEEIEAVVEITQQVEVEVEVPVESTVTATAPGG